MTRILVGLAVVGLVGFIVLRQFGRKPLDARDTINSGVQQVKEHSDINATQELMLRIQLAVADYTASTGTPPDSLEELVPKYFDQVPVNPATGLAMKYPAEEPTQVASASGASVNESVDSILEKGGFINPNTMEILDFVYDPVGKRDPFEPFDFSGESNIDTTLPPLQRYSIGQLKVTAIIKDHKGGFKAFVEDATGIGYPVGKGTRVGNASGVAVRITENAVFVVETRKDFTGEIKRKTVQMKLKRAKAEDKNAKFQRIRNKPGAGSQRR